MTKLGDEAFDVLRGGGVSFSFLRGDQPMRALVSGFTMGSRTAPATFPLLNRVAAVEAATESFSEQSTIEFVSAHEAARYRDLKHFSVLVRGSFSNGGDASECPCHRKGSGRMHVHVIGEHGCALLWLHPE